MTLATSAIISKAVSAVAVAVASLLVSVSPDLAGAIDGTEPVSIFAGAGSWGPSGDGGLATSAELNDPADLAIADDGTLYIVDSGGTTIRRVESGVITTILGAAWTTGIDGPAISSGLGVESLEVGPDGLPYLSSLNEDSVTKIDEAGVLRRVAGTGAGGFAGDGGLATDAQINQPSGLAFSPDGSLYISDNGNDRIRRVDPDGIITTVAGNGTSGFSGDGGLAIAAKLDGPTKIAVDWYGNVYFYDFGNDRVRKIDTAGIITTVAGNNSGTIDHLELGRNYPSLDTDLQTVSHLEFDTNNLLHIAMFEQILVLSNDSLVTPVLTTTWPSDGLVATDSIAGNMWGLASAPNGDMYISTGGDARMNLVYRLEAPATCLRGPVGGTWGTDNPTRASIYRLYCAYFQRYPDQGGYDYWNDELNTGEITLVQTSDFFSASEEFNNTYGALTNEEFLDQLYGNAFQRAADPGGRAYWLNILDTGVLTKGGVVLQFSDSLEFRNQTGTP